MRVRPEAAADVEAVRAVHDAAFAQAAEGKLVDALRGGSWWHPSLSLVAELDGEIVGHVLLTDVTLAGRPVFALGPIGVLPAHQRSGVGSALMTAAMDAAAATDRGLITLLGDPAYYTRFGFTPASDVGVVDPWGAPPGYFMVLRLPAYSRELVGTPEYPAPWLAV
jgi:putative acetyltransferase